MNDFVSVLTLAALLGSALMAGTFFAFSTFIMRALAATTPPYGIEAMQWINRTVINPWFLGAFMGTAAIGAVLAGSALWRWDRPGAAYLLAGGLLYAVGTFGVTVVFNVPMNNALAEVEAPSDEAAALWERYLKRWTRWNHVRTIAALLATAALAMA